MTRVEHSNQNIIDNNGESVTQRDERVSIGAGSSAVFLELLRLHPEIAEFSYTVFDPNDVSRIRNLPTDLHWVDRNKISPDFLQSLSEDEYNKHKEAEIADANGVWVKTQVIAIASLVKLSEETLRHIPMVDFGEPDYPDEYPYHALYPEQGYLVKTDRSWHFWGRNLMTKERWQMYMDSRILYDKEHGTDFFDPGYLEASLKRGFSALRIFGYPGTLKPTEPKVIKYI